MCGSTPVGQSFFMFEYCGYLLTTVQQALVYFAEQYNGRDFPLGSLESSYKPAQSTSTDFLERKSGTGDRITPPELLDILD